MSKADITHHLLPKKGIVETFVVEDAENPGKLSDFISFLYFYQQCLTKEELGHNHDLEVDATLYYYSFTKNSYENMIKMAMWLAKEDLGADSLCVNSQQDHDPDQL
jgi:glycylpeptide N-tetradecanoyltransferase